jgi:UDP-N-acetylmuramate--alanine ligase
MQFDLTKIKKVFFIGIGGIGVSAIARMMKLEGKVVSGQDINDSPVIEELRKNDIEIFIGQGIDFIPKDTDLIVYSRAVEVYDPEFFETLKSLNIEMLSYPQILGLVSENKYTIAISGSHGKTTTTAMIAHMLLESGKDPTVVVGSLLQGKKTNFIAGKSEYFVVEADEYKRAFLNLSPKILVITNIDLDHLDYYKDIEDIKDAFRSLVVKVPSDGIIICDPDAPHVGDVIKDANAKIVDYKKYIKNRNLKTPGEHNQKNAGCAGAVGEYLDISEDQIDQTLETFLGTWRRFEYKGSTPSGAIVYDDYAHHPSEVRASLSAFREKFGNEKKIIVLFQPHLFSRTKALWNEFVGCFDEADEIYLLPIFQAREHPDPSVTSEKLSQELVLRGKKSKSFSSFDEAQKEISNMNLNDDCILVTMGAGEAYKIGEALVEK